MKAKVRQFVPLLLVMVFFLLAAAHASANTSSSTPLFQNAPEGGDTPATLVANGVADSTVQHAKVWWWYSLSCAPTLDGSGDTASEGDSPLIASPLSASPDGAYRMEEIARIATTGGITRTLFVHDTNNPYCNSYNPELLSNVAADDDYLYWMSNEYDGLVQLSVEANVGDEPELLYGAQSQADEIEERGNYVYLMNDTYGIIRVSKTTGAGGTIVTAPQLGGYSTDLQITDEYVFWNRSGNLGIAYNSGGGGDGIASGVSSYIPENSLCEPGGFCYTTEYIFVGQGEQIRRYNQDTQTWSGVLYDSPVTDANVVDMTVDGNKSTFLSSVKERATPSAPTTMGFTASTAPAARPNCSITSTTNSSVSRISI
ncbi:MAG: hypothetical protein HC804_03485 [Anaerolineae bacterium]|nr:hypothetical protein [Anaerolineae bacterium]